MILGLDISTSITGVAILDESGEVIDCFAVDFKKCKTFFEKCEMAQKEIVERLYSDEFIDITSIYIEQSLQAFRPGLSSAKTLLTLSKFNGILAWMLYEAFNIEPEYIGATTARKQIGLTVPRGVKGKDVVMSYMLKTQTNWFQVEYTNRGNVKSKYYDMADAFVVASAGAQLCTTIKN